MSERLRGRGGQAVVEIGGKIKQGDDMRLDGRERLMSRIRVKVGHRNGGLEPLTGDLAAVDVLADINGRGYTRD